jgi:hypothetical protein
MDDGGQGGADSFSGTLRQRFDGENCSGRGTVVMDGRRQEVVLDGSASMRGTEYVLDGKAVEQDSPPQEQLDLYFTDIWPPEDGSWDAEVRDGVVTSVTPAPDEDGDED